MYNFKTVYKGLKYFVTMDGKTVQVLNDYNTASKVVNGLKDLIHGHSICITGHYKKCLQVHKYA